MTIRSEFQPSVDEFIDDLHSFATGSYLQEGETEFWEAPFDAKCLPELKKILEDMLNALEGLPDDPPGEDLAKVVNHTIDQLDRFNTRHEDAVLEPEEKEQINKLFFDAAASTGADDEALSELPEFE